MAIPLAVAASVKSPGLFLDVNLTAGQSSPGSAVRRCLMVSQKSAAGTITADTELVRAVGGEQVVSGLLGPGSLGHLASIALFREYGLAQVDLICPTASSGVAATEDVTFATGPPTVSHTVNCYIAGRRIQIVWAASETDTVGAATLAAAINAQVNLPVTATSALGVTTITAKSAGTWGNDIKLRLEVLDGTTGTVTAGAAALSTGTLEYDCTTALGLVTQEEYDLILVCTGNTDANDGTATSNPGIVKTHIDGLDEGQQAKLQQSVFAATGTLAALKVGTAALNFARAQAVFANNALSLPCEWAGAEVGARLKAESVDLAANRIRQEYVADLFTVDDLSADALTEAEIEDALNNGVTPVGFTSQGVPRPERPITTFHLDASANPDDRVLDTSRVTGTDGVAKDIRTTLPREFQGAKLSEDLTGPVDELPPGVVEVRDIKSFVDGRVRFFIALGVVKGADYQESVDNGTFVVRVNPSDPSQCDIVLPLKIVPPLAKFSVVVQHVGP